MDWSPYRTTTCTIFDLSWQAHIAKCRSIVAVVTAAKTAHAGLLKNIRLLLERNFNNIGVRSFILTGAPNCSVNIFLSEGNFLA